jgi:hypothetical protein
MTILSSGNVGIGTSSPFAKLSLGSPAGITSFPAYSTNDQASIGWNYWGASADLFTRYMDIVAKGAPDGTNGGSVIRFLTNSVTNGSNPIERMRVTSNGCIFVNTTSANITSNMRMSVKQTLGEGAAEVWTSWAGDVSTAAFWVIKYDNVNTTSQIFQRFAINNGGTACGQINANGASQVAFGSYSDIRLKENIAELEPQLDKILALKPCEFDYKDGSGHQIGFIAQEMQEVYPDVVNESLDGMLTLSGWNKTEARLVKAIQELKAEIDELKNK